MPTILVADDNSNIQKMVSLVFEEKGVRVVAVGNGEAACRKLPEVRPDLILADVFMPVRNGYEVCEFVRQNPVASQTPVILLVGAFDPLDEKEAQRVGANGVLKKPFVPPEPLIEMVQSFLGKFGEAENAAAAPAPAAQAAAPIEAKPAAKPAPVPMTEPEEKTAEFSFGTSAQDLEDSNATAEFAEPVATPSPKREEDDLDEMDSQPQSAWKRNRTAMDFDLPGSEPAASSRGSAPQKPAGKKKIGFGGANVPFDGEPAASRANEWMELSAETGDQRVETAHEAAQQESQTAEPVRDEPPISYEASAEISSASDESSALSAGKDRENAEPREDMPTAEVIPVDSFASDAEESAATVQAQEENQGAYATEPSNAPADAEIEVPALESESAPPEESFYGSSYESPARPPSGANASAQEISEAAPPVNNGSVTSEPENVEASSVSVDAVVAKVIEKLEPQIKEALANGVLRPLVKELLEREREKK